MTVLAPVNWQMYTNEYIWKVKRSAGVVVHTVRIRQATMDDDGDYACESRHQRASQIVHVNISSDFVVVVFCGGGGGGDGKAQRKVEKVNWSTNRFSYALNNSTIQTSMLRPIYVTLCFVVLLGDAVPEISHLHQKLAELKKKHGLEGVAETHKMDYPYRHQAIKFADIMPILSDYAAVHRERSVIKFSK
ncbi:unnamed protein product [Nippostrongylus brasiliensis]|uniref:Ig-like domain-containing protein n=1 Tax=Nippostrongylus brasiliensis TaxID=27835 RepID=A0A0N4YMF0_NIPBR|nr:unnamed protein product [Nippostrongylus brasiliensis]